MAAAFALYFAAQCASLALSARIGGNPGLWPAGAVGLVMILCAPDGWRWRVALGTLVANFASHMAFGGLRGAPLALALTIRLLGDWGGAEVLVRALGTRPHLDRSGPLLRFSALVGLAITPATALIGSAALAITSGTPFLAGWVRWYIPEVVMTLLLAPALWVGITSVGRGGRTPWRRAAEQSLALLVLVGGVAAVALQPTIAGVTLPISLIVIPVMIVIGFRYGVAMTAWAAVATFVTLLVITLNEAGPFAVSRAAGFSRLVAVELYAGTLGVSMVLLAAVLRDLRAAAARLQSFLETVDSPIIVVDSDRRIVGFSPAAQTVFERTQGERVTFGSDPLGPTRGPPELLHRRAMAWLGALSGESQVVILEPDESTRLEMRYEPMLNASGEIVGAVASATDLLRREHEEGVRARAERLEAIGRLAGGIAHDVNNLQTIVLGESYLLRQSVSSMPEATESLDAIDETVDRTKRLTTQLLAFSKAQVMAPRVVPLCAQVDAVAALLRRVVEEDTVIDVSHRGEPWNVAVDIGQFEQIMLNLATNARDAMPAGGHLWIETASLRLPTREATRLELPEGEYATLTVRDNGPGIAPDVLRNVFEPFFTTKGPLGTGLGLATVHAIVRKLGGAVDATSVVGTGTTFSLWFPRASHAPDTDTSAAAGASVSHDAARVVVCDDDPAIRRIVTRTLSGAGFIVHDAPTPAEALAWLAGDGRDTAVLVSDVVMPGMSGVELLRAARELKPNLHVLLMTGYSENDLLDLREGDRPDGVLPKPFHGADLIARVRTILALRSQG